MSRKVLPGGIEVLSTCRAVIWRKKGVLHREDGPAYERRDGTKRYYRDGLLHRENGPAVIRPDGTRLWFRHGILCRDDGPPILFGDGTREWFWGGTSYREQEEASPGKTEPDPHQVEKMLEIIASIGFQEA